MSEVSVQSQIKRLIELQKIDAEIYSFKRELKEKPDRLAELKNNFEKQKSALKVLEDKLKAHQVEHKNWEIDLKSKDDAIAKANAQLSLLKTNKEYSAKLSEIESLKADKSIVEEKILISFDTLDAAKADIDRERTAVGELERQYLAEKKVIEDSIKTLEEKIKGLDAQRSQVVPEVSKNHLSRYERVLSHTDGLAIVPVKSGSCGGCYMNVPAQVVNQIKMHDQLIFCETCARILYLEEEL